MSGKENDQESLHPHFTSLLKEPNEQLIASAELALNKFNRSGIVQQSVTVAEAARRRHKVLATAAIAAPSKHGGSNKAAVAATVARTAFVAFTGVASAASAAFPRNNNNTASPSRARSIFRRATGRDATVSRINHAGSNSRRVAGKEIIDLYNDENMESHLDEMDEDEVSEITMATAHETGHGRLTNSTPFRYPPRFP